MNMKHVTKRGRGRPKKEDIQKHTYMIRFNDADNRRFLKMLSKSGAKSKAEFIRNKVLNHKLKPIVIDKSRLDYLLLLTQFFAQMRGIKNNYNQCFSVLVRELGEDKARFMIEILRKSTLDFIQSMKDLESLVNKLREEWLPK